MREPILVVMAAGMGSRYGGLKQMDPVGSGGELIPDFSLYDAVKAGFKKAVFIIKKEHEADFRGLIDDRAGRFIQVEYAFQDITDIPDGYQVPEGREKPWGTGHAVLSARELVDAPFAVINADDYYGPHAFQSIYDFLKSAEDDGRYQYAMVGYPIENTLTENGSVARGVCSIDGSGCLETVTERTQIVKHGEEIQFTEDGSEWITIPEGTLVSLNIWGFTQSMMAELAGRFPSFLDRTIQENPMKGEYFLPFVVDGLIKDNKAAVKVLESRDKWYGVTYKEDRATVVAELEKMKQKGLYPAKLWV